MEGFYILYFCTSEGLIRQSGTMTKVLEMILKMGKCYIGSITKIKKGVIIGCAMLCMLHLFEYVVLKLHYQI